MLRGAKFAVTEESLRGDAIPTLAIVGSEDPLQLCEDPGYLATVSHPDYIANLLRFLKKHPTTSPAVCCEGRWLETHSYPIKRRVGTYEMTAIDLRANSDGSH